MTLHDALRERLLVAAKDYAEADAGDDATMLDIGFAHGHLFQMAADALAAPVSGVPPPLRTLDLATAAECVTWLRKRAKLDVLDGDRFYLCANALAEAYEPQVGVPQPTPPEVPPGYWEQVTAAMHGKQGDAVALLQRARELLPLVPPSDRTQMYFETKAAIDAYLDALPPQGKINHE